MPRYRLIFPPPLDNVIENTATTEIDSGDEVYGVGTEISYAGKLWRVSKAPLEVPSNGEIADLMVWPAD